MVGKKNYDNVDFYKIYNEYINSDLTYFDLSKKYNIPQMTLNGRFKKIKYNLLLNEKTIDYIKIDNKNDIKYKKENISSSFNNKNTGGKMNALKFLNTGDASTDREPEQIKNSNHESKKVKSLNDILPPHLRNFD